MASRTSVVHILVSTVARVVPVVGAALVMLGVASTVTLTGQTTSSVADLAPERAVMPDLPDEPARPASQAPVRVIAPADIAAPSNQPTDRVSTAALVDRTPAIDRWQVAALLQTIRPAPVVPDEPPPPPKPAAPPAPKPAAPPAAEPAETPKEPTPEPVAPAPAPDPTPVATSGGTSQLARVEAIADRLPFNWRATGVKFRVGCAPGRAACNWGLYTAGPKEIWIGPGAFENEARLFYVVAHEVVHAWQYANDPHSRMYDLADWQRVEVAGLEGAADCLAQAWGATTTYYWTCPSDARQHMQRVFASTQ